MLRRVIEITPCITILIYYYAILEYDSMKIRKEQKRKEYFQCTLKNHILFFAFPILCPSPTRIRLPYRKSRVHCDVCVCIYIYLCVCVCVCEVH